MKVYQAGQIGLMEWVLIIIGILWLAGFLRNTIYVPVVVKEKEKKEEEKKTKIDESTTISKPGKKDESDYTPFEEVKD
jgi:hypothetical protein